YANGWYTVERTPEEFHAAAKRVRTKGYDAVKLDPFGDAYYELPAAERRRAIGLVEAVRDAMGPDGEVFVEMHGRFTPAIAIGIAKDLAAFRPGWIEEHEGTFALPTGPGLGVTLDRDVVREHPRREIHFDLFKEEWHLRKAARAAAPR